MANFKKILFPTDFSPNAERALHHALRLVDFSGGEIIIQHVVRSYFENYPHWTTLFDIHKMQKHMDMYVEQEMERAVPKEIPDNISFRNLISEGRPAEQIVEAADNEQVDLVVMGPAKGAVTMSVIRGTRRPVLSVPAANGKAEPLKKLTRIVISTDCSPNSKKIIDYTFELKKRLDCNVTVLHVIELTNTLKFIRQGHFMDASKKMKTWAENQLKNLTPHEFLNDPSVQRLVIEDGDAADRIAEVAESQDAGLIVLGAHGYGPVQRHFVGTTTDKVLSGLTRPILTVQV